MNYKFALVGGDARNAKLAVFLEKQGHSVFPFALERAPEALSSYKFDTMKEIVRECDAVIGPTPFSSGQGTLSTPLSEERVSFSYFLEALPPNTLFIAGKIPDTFREKAEQRSITVVDLLLRDDLAILNCIPTAEGAVQIAMERLPTTVYGSKMLILGLGRVGRVLAELLRDMGAQVTVAVRKSRDMAWAAVERIGSCYFTDINDRINEFDIVYNTVPSLVLGKEELRFVASGTLLVDLASLPGGIDFEEASRLNLQVIHALSLPGKVAPVTAANNIASVVFRVLLEQEEVTSHA